MKNETSPTKVLKSCNCCLSHKAQVKLMTVGSRIAWCYSCKANTVWSVMEADKVQAHLEKKEKTQRFIANLLQE